MLGAQITEVTILLNRLRDGDCEAANTFAPLVWSDLHKIAQRYMARESRATPCNPPRSSMKLMYDCSQIAIGCGSAGTISWESNRDRFPSSKRVGEAAREKFLAETLAGKPRLRLEVDLMLNENPSSDEFLERLPLEVLNSNTRAPQSGEIVSHYHIHSQNGPGAWVPSTGRKTFDSSGPLL